jgi:hypothetical protein
MITKVYIQEYGNGRMEPEQQALLDEFTARGTLVQTFTTKLLDRNRLLLSKSTLVAGEVIVVAKALKYLGIEMPQSNSYPASLQPFLKRNVWESTLKEVVNQMYDGHLTSGLFIKPKLQAKKFTGFVLDSPDGLRHLKGASLNTIIYCCNMVEWRSEYRIFVIHSKIVGIKHYYGDATLQVDISVVEKAIQLLEQSGEATTGYGIDFGVLHNGETALIEWNDGFSLGAYQLDRKIYCELISARRIELVNKKGIFPLA